MIGSPLDSLIPGSTPDPSRSPASSGSAGSGHRVSGSGATGGAEASSGAGSTGPAEAPGSRPREASFADHLREASGSSAASAESASDTESEAKSAAEAQPASVLPGDFTPQREGREFTRPISFDAVTGQPGDVGTRPLPVVPNPARTAAQATIITGAGNPASTEFNPGQNPAHTVPPSATPVPPAASGSAAGAGPFGATAPASGVPASGQSGTAATTAAAAAPDSALSAAAAATSAARNASGTAAASTSNTTSAGAPGVAAVPTAPTAATAAAPAPSAESATPTPAVRAWTVQQLSTPVVQAAARALPNGTHLATVRISPEALGPVTLEATSRDGALRLEITAATEAGRENLRVVLHELRRELAAAQPGATLELSSGSKDAQNGTGPSLGGRPGEGKDQAGAGVGHQENGTTGPGAETAETGPERQPGADGQHDDGTDGLDVYA